ncbi:MAG: hypothetical protein K2X66_16370, partial [Cyanobacteria bacterium]|nr:hypothetical protein [Cyanobacteriota bacterium]
VSIFLGLMRAIRLLPVFGALFSVGLAQSQTLSLNTLAKPGVISDKGFYSGINKVSPEALYQVLPDLKGKAVFLEFKSKFCLACKKMDPILEKLLPKYPQVEKRVYDIMKDKETHADIFKLFDPKVVPIQLYINTQGEVVNVFYDFHDEKQLTASLSCVDPTQDGSACKILAGKEADALETGIQDSLASGSILTLVFAFAAGVISSFFPCTIAMLPILVGYMGGYSEGSKKDIFLQVTIFILGLATVMTLLGVVLSLVGASFGSQNSPILYYGIGILCIVMALQMMEIVHIPLPQTIKALPETKQGKLLSFYVLGCAFGLVASPCGTPVLAAILGIISKEGNILLGGAALFCYAVGQGILLLVVGLSTGLLKHKATFMKVGSALTKLSGVVIILVGIGFILQGMGIWTEILASLNIGE